MNPIEIISASAGSGKTYRLSEVLAEAVKNRSVRPHAVLATTFTRKAAAELRERVRLRLLQAGQAAAAVHLNAAIMGTVNSVCGQIVSDFAFSLGLPPGIRVLDEEQSAIALKRALSAVIDEDANIEIARLKTVFHEWNIEGLITRTVDLARSNGIGPDGLAASRNRCLADIDRLLGAPLNNTASCEKELTAAISRFLDWFATGEDKQKNTEKAAAEARRFLTDLGAGKFPKWQDWNKLTNLGAGKKAAPYAAPIEALAESHYRHPSFRSDLAAAVRLVFDLAARGLAIYAGYKQDRGFTDFTDQECLALELLHKPEVRDYLQSRLDLVLIDEFQDTSPIQLAIFLELAAIAKRSVWVGDQKQSIFGFRGADPELMNAAIDTILVGGKLETLPKSWRSRPELVHLTSALFAQAFPRHGIPADRVALEPAFTVEPAGLGPIVERWIPNIEGRSNKDKLAAALASAVKQSLDDFSVKVWDANTHKPRPVRPGDIAILCCQNSTASLIAEKLAELGIRSAQARAGLLRTPEARLVLSALRLWSDPADSLAAAEIARMIEHPEDPDRWLAALLQNPGPAAFGDNPIVSAIRTSSAAERSSFGVLAAFDRVLDLLNTRDLCRRWGDASLRLANLDALRALAHRFAAQSADAGAGMTPAGLVAFFADLDDGENDAQAYNPDIEAVVISTWHRSKGLEWPIVVLYELESDFSRVSFDPRIASDQKKISLDDPLLGRWIRYWPNPYYFRTKATYHSLMATDPAVEEIAEVESRESLRLLYVGWTRARDRVILACGKGNLGKGMLEEFTDGTEPLLSEPEDGKAVWGGHKINVLTRLTTASAPFHSQPKTEPTFATEGPQNHPPAHEWSDQSGKTWEVGKPAVLGEPIPFKAKTDMMNMGNAVHGFLAAYSPEMSRVEQSEMAEGLLVRWGVRDALSPENLLEIGDRFRGWVLAHWPDTKWHREWPVDQRLKTGTVARGVADLILETQDGLIIIDHKAYVADRSETKDLALEVGEQVQYYADGSFGALGKKILGMYIHFPMIGEIIGLK